MRAAGLKLLIAGSLAGGTLLLASSLFSGSSSGPPEIDRRLASLPALSTSASAGLQFHPVAGQRYVYAFERKISFSGLSGLAIPPVAFHGEFFVDVLESGDAGFEAVLSERITEAGGQPSPLFLAKIGARGEKLDLHSGELKGDEEHQHANILRDLACNWIFPLPADTAGEFTARFETLPGGKGGALLKKVKLAYQGNPKTLPELLSSEHFLQWSSELHLPGEEQGRESTRLGKGGASLEASSHYHFRFLRQEKLPAYSQALLGSLRTPAGLALSRKQSQHPDYTKLDWGTLLSQLRGLHRIPAARQLEVFGDLLKYLEMHPEKVAEVLEMLRDQEVLSAGPGSPLFKTLVGALASLGSAEAQSALREAYSDPACGISCKGTILAALTTTQAPLDGPTRDFLADSMQKEKNPDLAHGAAFALGSALQSAPPGDPRAGSEIAAILAAWNSLGAAGSMEEKLALLDVMGNSGRADFLPAIESALAAEGDATLRARAAFALRFISTDAAGRDLVLALGDSDARIRLAAANAMGFAPWRESFRSPLSACGNSDVSDQVRSSCREALARTGGQLASN